MRSRDYTQEHQETGARKYAYEFDNILRRYMMRSFDPLLPEGAALELGCYKGEFTELLSKRFNDLTVVEAAADLVAETRKRVGDKVKFVCSTFETAEPGRKYDAIFLMHTLEHIDEPVTILRRINSWLSRTGRLFLVVPNGNAPSRQIAVKMGLITHNTAVTPAEYEHGHRRTYTFDTLERDALLGGLQVLERGGVIFKALANFQFDRALREGVITPEYVEACYHLGMQYPDLCASIYLVCGRGQPATE